jgi:hypothetical protein
MKFNRTEASPRADDSTCSCGKNEQLLLRDAGLLRRRHRQTPHGEAGGAVCMRRWGLADLLEHDVGVDHQVVLRISGELCSGWVAGGVQCGAAGDVIPQVMLPHNLSFDTELLRIESN